VHDDRFNRRFLDLMAPVRRAGRPEEVVSVSLFLVLDDGVHVSGEVCRQWRLVSQSASRTGFQFMIRLQARAADIATARLAS